MDGVAGHVSWPRPSRRYRSAQNGCGQATPQAPRRLQRYGLHRSFRPSTAPGMATTSSEATCKRSISLSAHPRDADADSGLPPGGLYGSCVLSGSNKAPPNDGTLPRPQRADDDSYRRLPGLASPHLARLGRRCSVVGTSLPPQCRPDFHYVCFTLEGYYRSFVFVRSFGGKDQGGPVEVSSVYWFGFERMLRSDPISMSVDVQRGGYYSVGGAGEEAMHE